MLERGDIVFLRFDTDVAGNETEGVEGRSKDN